MMRSTGFRITLRLPEMIALAAMRATGANLPRISPKEVASIRIPLPPIADQKRFAGVLDQAGMLITKRRQAVALLGELEQSIFLDMFGKINECDMVRLGDCLTFVTSGGRGWAKYYSDSGSRFIRSLDVRMNAIGDEAVVYVTPPNNAEAKRTRVYSGDVLLTITGSLIGRVAPVPADLEGSYISQHVAIMRPDSSVIDPRFLSFFLSLPEKGQRQIAHLQYGQTKPGLNFEQIRGMKIPLPDIGQQLVFAEYLAQVRRAAESSHAYLQALEELFASLQTWAFRGEL